MVGSYVKIALRNMRRQKGYAFINIFGLVIGITGCLLICLYIFNEIQFEHCHKNRDRIYRVAGELNMRGQIEGVAALLPPLAPKLAEEFPEIDASVRIFQAQNVTQSVVLEYKENRFVEPDFYFVDPSIFFIFTFPLRNGNAESVLSAPWSIILTNDKANKYFGDENPIGKVIKFNDTYEFTVTGILENIPKTTQLQFPIMASTATLELIDKDLLNSWGHIGLPYNYILVNDRFVPTEFEAKLPAFLARQIPEQMARMTNLFIQPFNEIYLKSDLKMELQPTGDIKYVYLFSALAMAILIIACINFMNLATARSVHRSTEVGMRKTLGANRSQLIWQFLGESIFMSIVATIIAFGLFELLRHRFAIYLEKDLILNYSENSWIFFVLIGIAVFVGLIAGIYPAFFLSKFQPIDSIKGALKGSSRSVFRKVLVVFQYAISVLLIISTIVIFRQIHYVKHKNLGFDKELTVAIPIKERALQMQYQRLNDTFSRLPGIRHISGGFSYPGGAGIIKMGMQPEGLLNDEPIIMQYLSTDYGYLDALGIPLISGRDFSRNYTTDAGNSVILNQAAVNQIGWDNPIGKKISLPDMRQRGSMIECEVIGVVHDFHMRSLREKIEPLVLTVNPMMINNIVIRIQPENISETIAALNSSWTSMIPGTAFEYSFLDDKFNEYYRSEEKLGQLLSVFSGLAIFVACLGLFGLASFTTEQRTKEIGIRKVMGASVHSILYLLSKEFLKWVIISNIIAWPAAWYLMNKWLQNFAYHTEIQTWTLTASMILSVLIAILTVLLQVIKAATSNPVDSLRYE